MTMAPQEYDELDATALAQHVRNRNVSPVELVDAAIERIHSRNPGLNAVIFEAFDRAREYASAGPPDGPFKGVPFLLKDLLAAWEGAPMSHGSRFYRDWEPTRNSTLVDRFLASGIVILGKTNLPELGVMPSTENERFGATRNPWDRTRSPGGSSGGSAAAVASRMVPMASGGDGGGSIRMPASCCGLFGFKPGRGRNPIGPLVTEAWGGCTEEHVLTRSVRDSARMLDATCGPAVGERCPLPKPERPFFEELGRDPGKLRIAFTRGPLVGDGVHDDCRAALDDACALLSSLGHELAEATPVIDAREFRRSYSLMVSAAVAADVRMAEARTGRKARAGDFESLTWVLRAVGEAMTGGEHQEALDSLQLIGFELSQFLSGFDAWLTPTLATPPPKLGELWAKGAEAKAEEAIGRLRLGRLVLAMLGRPTRVWNYMPYTAYANVGGLPSMSVPLFWSDEELPIGVTITGGAQSEGLLFRLAAQLESERPWANRRPT